MAKTSPFCVKRLLKTPSSNLSIKYRKQNLFEEYERRQEAIKKRNTSLKRQKKMFKRKK